MEAWKIRRLQALREAEHVDGAVHAGLGRLHGIVLVVNGGGGAREIVDLIDLDIEREGHVVTHQLETRIAERCSDVVAAAGEEIVDAEHLVAAATSRSQRCEPRKPAPPVTRIFFEILGNSAGKGPEPRARWDGMRASNCAAERRPSVTFVRRLRARPGGTAG